MNKHKFKLKPLDIAAFVVYFAVTPLVLHSLPFFVSCAAEVLILVAVVLVVGLNHQREDEDSKRRQEEQNKKRWAEVMGRDKGADSK
jgi:uncharacterized sodium:solute symporter family permease YidK